MTMPDGYSDNYKILGKELDCFLSENKHPAPQFVSLDKTFEDAMDELTKPIEAIKIHGWNNFNSAVGGLRAKEFSIFCGPTGAGKTQWLADLSGRLMLGGVKHFVASVETGHTDFIKRVFSSLDRQDYNSGDIYHADRITNLKKDYAPLIKSKLIELTSYSTKISPRQMLCDLIYASTEKKCKVAILDNLNFFLPFVDASSENTNMDKVVHDFVVLCKNLPMHVIMVCHPKKTDNGRVNSEFDIKGSSSAVQEAHNVFLLNKMSKEDVENGFSAKDNREITFAKIRRRGRNVGRRIVYRAVDCSFSEVQFL